MKNLSIIIMMLFLALSQNANAKCKSDKIDPFSDFLTTGCTQAEIDKKYNAGTRYKEIMEKQRLARAQERQERYDTALEQMKRDNPNFKKPKHTKTLEKSELTDEDLENYKRKTGKY